MAADEAVFLLSRERISPPTIRFYAWLVPAVSIGRFQQIDRDIDLAACRKRSVDIVRRPTGGKAVFHGQDLTYAVVGVEQRDGFPADIIGTYRMISRCLIRGLREIGIEAQVAGEGRALPETPARASCFSAPSRYELLVRGRKICGSAQVRSHGAFLQHSEGRDEQIAHLRQSVTSLGDEGAPLPAMEALCRIMKTGFEAALGVRLEEGALTPDEEALKERLLMDKYMNDQWTLKGRAV
jgi:lipoate-protein ligase A